MTKRVSAESPGTTASRKERFTMERRLSSSCFVDGSGATAFSASSLAQLILTPENIQPRFAQYMREEVVLSGALFIELRQRIDSRVDFTPEHMVRMAQRQRQVGGH